MAGGLDERCADAWDVESEGSGDAASSAGSSPRNRPTAMEQGTGLAAARQGVAGVTWEQDATSKEQANNTMPSRCHHDAITMPCAVRPSRVIRGETTQDPKPLNSFILC